MTALQRIEALPGDGRWAVTFRGEDAVEHTAVVQLTGASVAVAAASLPRGWAAHTDAFRAVSEALLALEKARSVSSSRPALRDVPGGWDVTLGNVVQDGAVPACTAHGAMAPAAGDTTTDAADGTVYECAECGARALAS